MTAQPDLFQLLPVDASSQLAPFLTHQHLTQTHSPIRTSAMIIRNLLSILIFAQVPSPPLPLSPQSHNHCRLRRPHLFVPITHPTHSSRGRLRRPQRGRAPLPSASYHLSHPARFPLSLRRARCRLQCPILVVLPLLSHNHPNSSPQKYLI